MPVSRSKPTMPDRPKKAGNLPTHDYPALCREYDDALSRFRFALEDRGSAAKTIIIYRRGAERFLRYLQHEMGLEIALDKVSKEHTREWLRSLRESGLKPASIHTAYQGARQFFKAALEDGEVTANPFEGLTLPRQEMPAVTILTPDDVQRMVNAAKRDKLGFVWGKRDAAILLLLYDAGLRASELLSVRESDIDWRLGAVLIMGKGQRQRWVGLGATALRALNRYLAARKRYEAGRKWWKNDRGEEAPIWLSRKGGILTPSGLKRVLHRRAREGGVEKNVHPHAFRHSAATDLATEMTESELRSHFGWSPNSPQVFRYTRSNLAQRAIVRHRRAAPGDRIRL